MLTLRYLPMLAVVLAATAFSYVADGNYTISDDYVVKFSGRGANGTFGELEGRVAFDPAALASSAIDVSVATATIATGNSTKDAHARGESWLHAEAYPRIRFVSEAFAKTSSGFTATGALTLRGVTREVTLPFTFEPRAGGGTFRGTLTVDREDYGIEGSFGQAMVADEFEIELVVPVKG